MGNSLNIPAVKVELGIGVSTVVAMARAMGAPPYQLHGTDSNGFPNYTTDDPVNTFGPSLTLGGYGETPLQMATGASVLATQGLLRQPYAIDVITRGDQLLYMHELDPGKRVLDARVAFIMQAIMSNDNNRAMIFGRNSLLTLRGRLDGWVYAASRHCRVGRERKLEREDDERLGQLLHRRADVAHLHAAGARHDGNGR